MSKLLVANWKMNPRTEREAERLARAEDMKNVVICPPFPFLAAVKKVLRKATLGAQNMFWESKGAYTGEVSPSQLKSLGVRYIIIGHSERRRVLHETDEMVNKKVLAALKLGFHVIVCVGEPKAVRRKGLSAVQKFVAAQLKKDLEGLSKIKHYGSKITITYEPIWAISTAGSRTSRDNADTPENALQMIRFIKYQLAARYSLRTSVLYGGSVALKNAADFLKHRQINGGLVGGASIRVDEFRAMVKKVSTL